MPTDTPVTTPASVAHALAKVERPTPALAEAIRRGYEPKDISLRGLFIFLGTLVVTLLVVLVAIYGIMMALVAHDRSNDLKGVAVSIYRPATYAPLQPSVEHPTEDWEDMILMRQTVQAILNSDGTTATGRRYMNITSAMDQVVPHLVVSPQPFDGKVHPQWTYPSNSVEGLYNGSTKVN